MTDGARQNGGDGISVGDGCSISGNTCAYILNGSEWPSCEAFHRIDLPEANAHVVRLWRQLWSVKPI